MQVPTVLTDIAEVQAALQHNIDLNPHLSSLMSAQVLDWHSPLTVIQHIIESDGGHTRLHQSGCKELENTYLPSNSSTSEHDGQCVHSQGEKPTRVQSSQCENSSCLAQDAFQVPGSYQRRLQQLEQGNEGCSEIRQGQKAGHSRKLLVLAADCVWVEDLVHPFVRALKAVCSLCDNSLVLFAHKERSRKVDKVMITALQEDFTIESVPVLSGERRGSIRIMQLCLKCRRNTVAGI
jgi:Lysine methyltransferase